jgi:hypothetical protein
VRVATGKGSVSNGPNGGNCGVPREAGAAHGRAPFNRGDYVRVGGERAAAGRGGGVSMVVGASVAGLFDALREGRRRRVRRHRRRAAGDEKEQPFHGRRRRDSTRSSQKLRARTSTSRRHLTLGKVLMCSMNNALSGHVTFTDAKLASWLHEPPGACRSERTVVHALINILRSIVIHHDPS